ncbi:MAG TPA: hypothetical protein VGE56_04290, partial [Rhodocyclaceae bacterium]
MVTRRDLLQIIGASGAGLLASTPALAQHEGHDMANMPGMGSSDAASTPTASVPPAPVMIKKHPQGYLPVRTLNGWTLPYKMNGGVKEFHLVAEEIEHEF